MSNRRKVKIYDKCVKEANSKDVSYNTALADLVFYHHYKWVKAMLVIKTICEVPEQDKISLIERLVPVFKKAAKTNSPESFIALYDYLFKTKSFPGHYIPELIQLCYNPEDCFKFDKMNHSDMRKQYSEYVRIMEYVQTMVEAHLDEEVPKIKLLKWMSIALKLSKPDPEINNNQENVLIPNIVIYCLMKGYDTEKFFKMIYYSIVHLNELYSYLQFNDNGEEEHDIDLCLNTMEKIEESMNDTQIIR